MSFDKLSLTGDYFFTIQINIMQKQKINEGIKPGPPDAVGLQRDDDNTAPVKKVSGTHNDISTGEKDADDMVHEPQNEFPTDNVEQDLDQVVHQQTGGITTAKEAEDDLTDEQDMDELVHRNSSRH
jgi:hypothetical protein